MFIFTCLFYLSINAAHAVPITNLVVSDSDIMVGETFTIAVELQNDITTEGLLSFGFDLQPLSPILSLTSFAVGPSFFDASFGPNNFAGLAFPAIMDSNIQLVTLTFEALSVGSAVVDILGIFDGAFYGAFLENSGYDISASTDIEIGQQIVTTPVPSMLLLLLGGLVFLRKKRLSLATQMK